MLSPRYLDGLSDELVEIYSQLEADILQDMARRIKRLGKITESTEWQARMLAEAGGLKTNIGKILTKYDKAVMREIATLCADALKKNAANDNRIFKEATGRTVSASNAQAMLSLIQKCHSDLSRLTLTTAATSETLFVQQANRAYMDVQSGAFDYDTATRHAADAIAERGITAVQYRNGKPVTLTIESAVRMNILTSVNQTAANMTLNNCEELDCDLVETSAHVGARPEHEEWQGQIFSRSGNNKKYRPFSVCGLGSVTGLCGINCRHSFYPYFEGTERHHTQDDLDEMAGEKVTYGGREMTRYEGEQGLRKIERSIRAWKRKALTEEAAGADSTLARRKLGEWQAKARDFTKQTGIARDGARERVGTATGKQPRGITPLSFETKNKNAAEKLFPKEEWEEKATGVFVAKGREPKTKQQTEIFKKEYDMSLIAQKYGHTVYMLPETSTGKNPDAIMDGMKTEFKNITGGLNKVGIRFREAMKQGDNVYLKIDSDIDVRDVYKKIRGEIIHSDYKTGFVYVYINSKMYKWSIGKMR